MRESAATDQPVRYWKGRPLSTLTRAELEDALSEVWAMYEREQEHYWQEMDGRMMDGRDRQR